MAWFQKTGKERRARSAGLAEFLCLRTCGERRDCARDKCRNWRRQRVPMSTWIEQQVQSWRVKRIMAGVPGEIACGTGNEIGLHGAT